MPRSPENGNTVPFALGPGEPAPLHYALPCYSIAMATVPLELDGSIWLRAGAQTGGGKSRIDLLTQIDATGSISAAARAVGMSYKGAWDAIDAMNNLAGEPLVLDRKSTRLNSSH